MGPPFFASWAESVYHPIPLPKKELGSVFSADLSMKRGFFVDRAGFFAGSSMKTAVFMDGRPWWAAVAWRRGGPATRWWGPSADDAKSQRNTRIIQ